jgi:hypothetical protein
MARLMKSVESDPSASDLRTLTVGFRELARGATVRVARRGRTHPSTAPNP